jgi:hypothetical protein
MNMLNDALALHWKSLKVAAGETVQYVRGSSVSDVSAVIGQSEFEEASGEGETRTLRKSTDFLILRDDLGSEPQRGDVIKRSTGEVYDLLPGSSGSSWHWSDGRQTHYRIHTILRKSKS